MGLRRDVPKSAPKSSPIPEPLSEPDFSAFYSDLGLHLGAHFGSFGDFFGSQILEPILDRILGRFTRPGCRDPMPPWGRDSFQEIPGADLLEACLIRQRQAEPDAAFPDPDRIHAAGRLATSVQGCAC